MHWSNLSKLICDSCFRSPAQFWGKWSEVDDDPHQLLARGQPGGGPGLGWRGAAEVKTPSTHHRGGRDELLALPQPLNQDQDFTHQLLIQETNQYDILFLVYTSSDPQPGAFSCLLLKFIQFLVPVSELAASLLSSCSAIIRRPKHNLSSFEIHAYVKQSFCSLHSAHVMNQRFNNIKSLEMLKPLEINQIGSHFSRT